MPKKKKRKIRDVISYICFIMKDMIYNFLLNADGWDQAMMKFDVANFPNRDDWKIYVACGHQPTGGKQ